MKNIEHLLSGYTNGDESVPREGSSVPKGYWMVWDNVETILKNMISELGHFPTDKEFKASKYKAVPGAIRKYHGGIPSAQKKLGIDSKRKPMGYWKQWTNVKNELEEVIERFGRLPTQKELTGSGYATLSTSIVEYHGGFSVVRRKIGRESDSNYRKYNDKRDVIKAIGVMLTNHPELKNQLPSSYWMRKHNYGSLAQAIEAHHGGIPKLRTELGQKNNRKPNGYWSDFNKVKEELADIVKVLGRFPTAKELRNNGNGDIYNGIRDYHGGLSKVKVKLGQTIASKPRGYWKNLDNVCQEIQRAIDDFGYFPTAQEMRDRRYHSLINGVTMHHGGFSKLKEILGERIPQIDRKGKEITKILEDYSGGNTR